LTKADIHPPDDPRKDGPEGKGNMPLLDHLSELGQRLKRVLIAFIIVFAGISVLPDPSNPFGGQYSIYGYNFLIVSLMRRASNAYLPGYTLLAASPEQPILALLDISLAISILITLPYMFHEVYAFVAPGLYQKERKVIRKYLLPFSILLAVGGVFGLLVIFPTVLRILLLFYGPLNIAHIISLQSFVSLLILVPVLTGIAFTFPVYVVPLVELQVISAKQLSSARKWVYIGVALAVSIANPDPTDISSIPIILPIFVLYEITVLVSKRVEKNRAAKTLV
jgi:sec-independent protein translocase protein TatC